MRRFFCVHTAILLEGFSLYLVINISKMRYLTSKNSEIMDTKQKEALLSTLATVDIEGLDAEILLLCMCYPEGLYIHEINDYIDAPRSSIERSADRLIDAKHLTKKKIGKRYKFFAQDYNDLIAELEGRAENLEKQLSKFEKEIGGSDSEIDVLYYEGVEGTRSANLDEILRFDKVKAKDRTIYLIGADDHTRRNAIFLNNYADMRLEKKLAFKALVPDSFKALDPWKNNERFMREVRYVKSARLPLGIKITIYADTVGIQYFESDVGAFIIRNQKIADLFRFKFNRIWDSSDVS